MEVGCTPPMFHCATILYLKDPNGQEQEPQSERCTDLSTMWRAPSLRPRGAWPCEQGKEGNLKQPRPPPKDMPDCGHAPRGGRGGRVRVDKDGAGGVRVVAVVPGPDDVVRRAVHERADAEVRLDPLDPIGRGREA